MNQYYIIHPNCPLLRRRFFGPTTDNCPVDVYPLAVGWCQPWRQPSWLALPHYQLYWDGSKAMKLPCLGEQKSINSYSRVATSRDLGCQGFDTSPYQVWSPPSFHRLPVRSGPLPHRGGSITSISSPQEWGFFAQVWFWKWWKMVKVTNMGSEASRIVISAWKSAMSSTRFGIRTSDNGDLDVQTLEFDSQKPLDLSNIKLIHHETYDINMSNSRVWTGISQ